MRISMGSSKLAHFTKVTFPVLFGVKKYPCQRHVTSWKTTGLSQSYLGGHPTHLVHSGKAGWLLSILSLLS